jgi:hypothetical protein
MNPSPKFLAVGLALALPLFVGGCDRTVSHTEKSSTSSDGTVRSKETTVTEKSDGTVVKKEETKKETPSR